MAKRFGIFKLLAVLTLPVLVMSAGVAGLVYLHEKRQELVAVERSAELADVELKRLTGALNLRLNEVREDLLRLYGEQLNLAQALSESDREKFVFYRREHLSALAVLVKNVQGTWDVQKYYLKPEISRPTALDLFQEAARGVMSVRSEKPFGFWAKGAALPAEHFAVAFGQNDATGKPFVLAALVKPSYIFSFCRLFGENLGDATTSAFVLDERGRVVCHAQPRFNGTDFAAYSFFAKLRDGAASGQGRAAYENVLGLPVSASFKRVESSGVLLTAEAAVSRGRMANPFAIEDLIALAAVVLALIALCLAIVSKKARAPSSPDESGNLKQELKDLETALLDLQSTQAFIAGFQKAAAEQATGEDLGRLAIDSMSVWGKPIVWCPAQSARNLECGPFANWSNALEPFQLVLDAYDHPAELAHDAALAARLAQMLARTDLVMQPVYYGDKLWGLIVVADAGEKAEVLPQIAQIMAIVAQARASTQSPENGA